MKYSYVIFCSSMLMGMINLAGCGSAAEGPPVVVICCAVDREFAQPVLDAFATNTGIRVEAKFDTESTKSVALAEQIRREKSRPRCDVFWNNEVLHTLRLDREGLLAPSTPSEQSHFPASFRSPAGHWHALAARARVLLINTNKVALDDAPTRIVDLSLPQWKGEVGMAKPLFGTTATHWAVLFQEWGEEKTKQFWQDLLKNKIRILSGNKQVAVEVGQGSLAIGWTDTDDAMAEVSAGRPVAIVYPDTGNDDDGLLLIPNTVAVIQGAPHAREAKAFVDFLVSREGETLLNNARCAQVPLHDELKTAWEPSPSKEMKRMVPDFSKSAEWWDQAQSVFRRWPGGAP